MVIVETVNELRQHCQDNVSVHRHHHCVSLGPASSSCMMFLIWPRPSAFSASPRSAASPPLCRPPFATSGKARWAFWRSLFGSDAGFASEFSCGDQKALQMDISCARRLRRAVRGAGWRRCGARGPVVPGPLLAAYCGCADMVTAEYSVCKAELNIWWQ